MGHQICHLVIRKETFGSLHCVMLGFLIYFNWNPIYVCFVWKAVTEMNERLAVFLWNENLGESGCQWSSSKLKRQLAQGFGTNFDFFNQLHTRENRIVHFFKVCGGCLKQLTPSTDIFFLVFTL